MKIFLRLEAPFEWVKVDGAEVDSFGVVNSVAEYPIGDETVIAVVPGRYVVAHKVNLPAKTKRQFEAAVPYALEEQLSQEIEDYHFSIEDFKAGQDTLVYVVAREKMAQWRELATEHQIPVEQLLPDFKLLPMHDVGDYTIARSDDELTILNKNGFGAVVDTQLIDFWLADVAMDETLVFNDEQLASDLKSGNEKRDLRYWDFGDRMSHWLSQSTSPVCNLLSDEFMPRIRRKQYKSIHTESAAILGEMFPDANGVPQGKERFYIEQAIKKGQVSAADFSQFQPLLATIAPVLNRNRVQIDTITFSENSLVIVCRLSNLSQVDQIDKQINNIKNIGAELLSSNVNEGVVIARYKVSG